MDTLLLEFGKFGAAGVMGGIVVGMALLLLRNLITRSDRLDAETIRNAGEAINLVKSQIIGRDADLSWARAKIDANQRDFLDALRAERETRERQTEALLNLLRADHREAMDVLGEIRDGVTSLTSVTTTMTKKVSGGSAHNNGGAA